jgi:RNA polymerase sigma factor (TIGR02999 family)
VLSFDNPDVRSRISYIVMASTRKDPDLASTEVTRALDAVLNGEPRAAEQLLPLVYDELRRLAAARLAQEAAGQTLQATALVHEAYLRLVGSDPEKPWEGRGHFFAAAAEAMRRILVENARRKRRLRHGGGRARVGLELELLVPAGEGAAHDVLALSEALDRLALEEPAAAQVVKLRYFGGLTTLQASSVMGVSLRTANRHWVYARAWLYHELNSHGDAPV